MSLLKRYLTADNRKRHTLTSRRAYWPNVCLTGDFSLFFSFFLYICIFIVLIGEEVLVNIIVCLSVNSYEIIGGGGDIKLFWYIIVVVLVCCLLCLLLVCMHVCLSVCLSLRVWGTKGLGGVYIFVIQFTENFSSNCNFGSLSHGESHLRQCCAVQPK